MVHSEFSGLRSAAGRLSEAELGRVRDCLEEALALLDREDHLIAAARVSHALESLRTMNGHPAGNGVMPGAAARETRNIAEQASRRDLLSR